MNAKEEIELTVRIAGIGKALFQMAGCNDKALLKLMYREVVDLLAGLAEFIDS